MLLMFFLDYWLSIYESLGLILNTYKRSYLDFIFGKLNPIP